MTDSEPALKSITYMLPNVFLEAIETLVNEKLFPSRSEMMRSIIAWGVERRFNMLKQVKNPSQLAEAFHFD